MVGANRFTEQEQGCRAEIVIQRIPAVEGQRDLLGRRGPEIAQNAPEISYDTAAINHGPHASARAVMAQQIPHQEEAQVSLQDGVEQIDVDRQYCVEKGADRGGEDNEEEKQGQLSARAGVCDPLQKGSRQIDPHHRTCGSFGRGSAGRRKRHQGKQALLCAGHRQADRSGSRRIGGAPAAEGVSDRTWTG